MLLRRVFTEISAEATPSATPDELAAAIIDCLAAGVHLINISAALLNASFRAERSLEATFDAARQKGVLVAAAAGNKGSLGSTAITPHPWVLPVGACDRRGRPSAYSNFGPSIGLRGLSAPGDGISSLTPVGATADPTGTSSAAPLVTGAIALMGSEFPAASAMQVRLASARAHPSRRLVPPLLNAIAGWRALAAIMGSPE